ncbi:MAG: hypothetical protein FJX25_03985 [Alphaproteobacteria bacterium]|nr:hypothetical protein [Alphaproteobacteria bacterium]
MWKWLARLIHEYSPDIILVLSAIMIFLIVPPLFEDLIANEDSRKSVDISLKILGAFLAVLASVGGYRRFFRGRIFAPRLTLGLKNQIIRKLSDGNVLHAADVEAENIGGVTIWDPTISFFVQHLDLDENCSVSGPATEGVRQRLRRGGNSGIEPGETVVYHFRYRVPADVEAFRVSAELSVDCNDAWHRTITVSNNVDDSTDPKPSERPQ